MRTSSFIVTAGSNGSIVSPNDWNQIHIDAVGLFMFSKLGSGYQLTIVLHEYIYDALFEFQMKINGPNGIAES